MVKPNISFVFTVTRFCQITEIMSLFNTLSPRQNGRHFPDDIIEYASLGLDEVNITRIKIDLNWHQLFQFEMYPFWLILVET